MNEILHRYISDDNHRKYNSTTTFKQKQCSSIYEGTVKFIGKTDNTNTVIVQTGSGTCMMYQGLKSLNVSLNDDVHKGDNLGSGYNNSISVASLSRTNKSHWSVYINGETWYKQAPDSDLKRSQNNESDLVLDSSQLFSSLNIEEIDADEAAADSSIYNKITDSVKDEFTGNKG